MTKLSRPAALVPAHPKQPALLPDLRHLILTAREQVARTVDSTLVALNWEIGQRIRQDILREKRAGYGERIVATLSQQLVREFGDGWSRFNLARMLQFAERFPDEEIVSALRRQLSWTHFKRLIYLPDALHQVGRMPNLETRSPRRPQSSSHPPLRALCVLRV